MDATQARDVVKMNLPRVLENLRLLVSEGVNVIPRLPLIHGFTLSRENMQQALDVLIPLKIRQIHLLPFHQYGEPKYRLLGKTWSMKEVPAPSSADVTTMREMAERAGFQVTVEVKMAYLGGSNRLRKRRGAYLYGGGTAGKVVPVREVGRQH